MLIERRLVALEQQGREVHAMFDAFSRQLMGVGRRSGRTEDFIKV
jgi:hypothetical protein